MPFWKLTTVGFVSCLVAACSPALTNPCDVLVELRPLPATNSFIVKNDRDFAVGVAQHRERYKKYSCE